MGRSGKVVKKPNIEDDEVYHVEVISKARVVPVTDSSSDDEAVSKKKKRKDKLLARWEYYVKWAGYDSDANSWEPEENVADCQRLLSSFWDHIGLDNEDYEVGYIVQADEQWIKREKKFFAKEYRGVQEQLRKQKEQEERVHKTQVTRQSTSTSWKGKGKAIDIELTSSDSEDDKPLSQVVPQKRKSIQVTSDDGVPVSSFPPPSKTQKTGSFSRKVTLHDPVEDRGEDGPSNGPLTDLFTPSPDEISMPKPLPKVHAIPLPPPAKKPQISARPSKRPYNQHASIAAGTVDMSASRSAISTKQRLAQQALKPVLPGSSALPVPLPADSDKAKLPSATSTRHALTSLSFKKSATTIQSPRIAVPESFAESFHNNLASRSTVLESEDPNYMSSGMVAQVDAFLKTVMPPELAAPMMWVSSEVEHGPIPLKAVLSRKLPPPQTRIPKKWKWSGPLILENADRQNETMNVTIQDCTDPVAMGLRFNIVLTEVEKLIAPSLHDFKDVATLLRTCQPVSQLGRIASQEDTASLSTLSLFMSKQKQIILIPAILDEEIVGFFLLFSPDSDLCRKFSVPQDLRQPRSLVISLVSLELTTKQRALDWRQPISDILPRNTDIEQTIEDSARWERSIRTKISYHHALRVLKFPKALHDFMAIEHKRPFCVWWDGGDNTNVKSIPGIETMYLLSIMEQCRAGNVGLKSTARVVFIHIGALKSIHKMPQFMDRRANHPLVQFYTYGTHESVAPSTWGVREIWPCGGVVTFMPQAALDDFFGLLHRVRQIYAHPLWTSYVIPSVIGMIARLICGNEDPLVVFDRGDFLFKELLTVIVDGELAMITAPRDEQHSTSSSELSQQWITGNILSQHDSEREILQYAVASLNARYSNIQPSEWTRCIAEELSTDLSYMQRQPALMRNYRRYVVLRDIRQEISLPDSFEWVTTSSFDFRDEFFPKQ